MSKKHVAVAAVAVAAVLAIVLLALWMWMPHRNSTPEKQQPVLSQWEAQTLERAITSASREEQARVLVPEKREAQWDARAVVPPGAQLKIDYAKSAMKADGTAVVPAKLSSSPQITYMIKLRRESGESGRWLIVETWKE